MVDNLNSGFQLQFSTGKMYSNLVGGLEHFFFIFSIYWE